jgi:hypothetical protein
MDFAAVTKVMPGAKRSEVTASKAFGSIAFLPVRGLAYRRYFIPAGAVCSQVPARSFPLESLSIIPVDDHQLV